MAIERLNFPEIIEYKVSKGKYDFGLARAVDKFHHLIERLAPGEYDYGQSNDGSFRYDLVVNQDGTGVYRMIATTPDSTRIVHIVKRMGIPLTLERPGGTHTLLGKLGDNVVIAAEGTTAKVCRLKAVIFYVNS